MIISGQQCGKKLTDSRKLFDLAEENPTVEAEVGQTGGKNKVHTWTAQKNKHWTTLPMS